MEPILSIKHIAKTFHSNGSLFQFGRKKVTHALKDISFNVYPGESFGVVGESGSGKTTLANVIMGMVTPDAGEIYFENRDLLKMSHEERRSVYLDLQMVFQDPYSTLDPKKTIGWSIMESLLIFGSETKEECQDKVMQVLNDVDLDETYFYKYPHELSGGQRQRIAIASSIILRPKFIIIDEGVSSLDVSIQAAILNLLNDLKERYQLTYLFISHDLNVIEYFCDRIAVMYNGDLIEVFETENSDINERAPYTKKLFDAIPQIYLEEVRL